MSFHDLVRTGNDAVLVLFGEFDDLVPDEGDVPRHVEPEVLGPDEVEVGLDFDTVIGDGTEVLGNRGNGASGIGCTGGKRIVQVENQVAAALVEILDIEIPAVEQAGFQTDAPGSAGLPLDVRGLELGKPEGAAVGILAGRVKKPVGVVAGGGVVTHFAVVGAEFEAVHPGQRLHERLLGNHPVGTDGPEVTPFLAFPETGRTVPAEGRLHIVFVHEGIAGAAEETLGAVVVAIGIDFRDFREVPQVVLAGQDLGSLVGVEIFAVPEVVLVTGQDVEAVVPELAGPAEVLLKLIVEEIVLIAGTAAVVALAVADDGAVVGLVGAGAGGHIARHGEGEVLEEVEFRRRRRIHGIAHGDVPVQFVFPEDVAVGILVTGLDGSAGGIDVLAAVPLLVAEGVQDILSVVGLSQFVVVQVCGIHRSDLAGVHEQVGVTAGAILVTVGVGVVLMGGVDVQAGLEPADGTDVGAGTGGEALEAAVGHVTVLVQVTEGEIVVTLVGGSVSAEVVFLTVTVPETELVPVQVVGEVAADGGVGDHAAVLVKQFVVRFVEDIDPDLLGNQVRGGVSGGFLRSGTVLDLFALHCLPVDFHPLPGVRQVVFRNTALIDTLLDIQVHVQAALRALFGGDQDDAVGRAVAVQGGGGGVLEDRDGLDVGGVQVGNVTAEGDPVQDVQDGRRTVDGSDTADVHVRIVTRRTDRGIDLDTGNGSFQGGRDRGSRPVGELFAPHGGDGAGQGRPFRRTVGDGDDSLFQGFAVQIHDDIDIRLYRNFLRLHADEGENEGFGVRGDPAEVEGTVDFGNGSHLRSLDEDGNAGEGFSVLITDGTPDIGNLCECGTGKDQDAGQEKKESFHHTQF